MAQSFACPSCGASLEYQGSNEPVVRCSYCDSVVIVPEGLRAQSHAAHSQAASVVVSPLTIDLRDLPNAFAKLRAIKQLVRDGQLPEAARVYQEVFTADSQEAEEVMNRLASGQAVMISGSGVGDAVPVVSGTQAAQMIADQFRTSQELQRKISRVVTCVIVIILFSILASVAILVAGNLLLASWL